VRGQVLKLVKSVTHLISSPKLRKTVLVEGLPGIGLVANIATAHLIKELKAEKFGEIISPFFQDFAVSDVEGGVRSPVVELYFSKLDKKPYDLIFLYGNTQALTIYGQYELCGKILDVAENFNCSLIACMGGLRKKDVSSPPKVFCAATDLVTLNQIMEYNLGVLRGYISGVAGILMGLGKLRNIPGFCLLAETLGIYPDAAAAKAALTTLCLVLKVNVDMTRLDIAVKGTNDIVQSFGTVSRPRSPFSI
jgi:uncharacterized protein (TIGR00162 family)